MYKKFKLDNGLKVITHQMPGMRSASLGIWIKVGGRYETPEIKGISHFLEHMLFKGTKKYSCRKIKESIEGVGGSLNAFTSEELTCYLAKVPSRYLESTLDVLSDMALNPTLPALEIEKERTVILEEIKMYKDQPQSYVYDLLDELLWPAQPLGQPIIGTTDSVGRMKREGLMSFKNNQYTPSNMVISAAGSLEPDKLIRHIKKLFSKKDKGRENSFSRVKEMQGKPQVNIFVKDTEQTHLALGFHGFKRAHPLRHALGLLHVALGGNMSSRLFNEVREKRGLAYEIGTSVKRFHDTGEFLVHAGIDNQKVTPCIRLILEELGKVKDKPIGSEEFRRSKEFYLAQLMLALEDTLDHMLWIGESTATLDKTYSLEEIFKEVKLVTREDLRRVAREIFRDQNLNLALIGPLKGKEKDLYSSLKVG